MAVDTIFYYECVNLCCCQFHSELCIHSHCSLFEFVAVLRLVLLFLKSRIFIVVVVVAIVVLVVVAVVALVIVMVVVVMVIMPLVAAVVCNCCYSC